MIPESKIEEIRERTDIVEIVGEYVSLKRAGSNFKGVCPFHADADPSFNVSKARGFFHCFGCGVSGDVFGFLQKIEGIDFTEAAKRLASRYGITVEERTFSPKEHSLKEKKQTEKERRLRVLEMATVFFEENLWKDIGSEARKYLAARGVSIKTAKKFRLGYAPNQWQGLIDYLSRLRITAKEAQLAGLVINKDGNQYDRFRNRLVFTIEDSQGNPIAFSARALKEQDKGAKYINSPETQDYTKGKTLFGLHQARVALSKTKEAILVEGNFDVVAMHEAGFENVLAPLGTAFTRDQALLLRRRIEKVIVMFDGDRAGKEASARIFPVLAEAGISAYVVALKDGEDPDSLLNNGSREEIASKIKEGKGLFDEIISASAEASDGTVQDIVKRVKKLGPYIKSVKSSFERDLFLQKIAGAFNLAPSVVIKYLKGFEPEKKTERSSLVSLPGYQDERELIGLLMDLPTLCEEAEKMGIISLVNTPTLKDVAKKLLFYSNSGNATTALLLEDSDPSVLQWLAKRGMEKLFTDEQAGREALVEIMDSLNKRIIGNQIAEVAKQVKKAHVSGDDMMVLALQRRKTELQRQLHGLSEDFDKGALRN